MPVLQPESSYSRRYGREESSFASSYSRSTSLSGIGGRSYMSSYSSPKSSTTLPPRPPAYEVRKYTDTSLGSGSRFLSSSSTSRANYRASVSPSRSSYSSVRRQLESSSPLIAERIKAIEMGESDEPTNTTSLSRMSRFSTVRTRDSPKSNYSNSYSRDRSGSKEYSSPLVLSNNYSRGESVSRSTTTTAENTRNRVSPSGSNSPGNLSRSGSGAMKNGLSRRLGSIEVNSENDSSSKGVATTTTTSIATKSKTVSDRNIDDKCAKDLENNESSSDSSSTLSDHSSAKGNIQMTNGHTNNSHNVNNGIDDENSSSSICGENVSEINNSEQVTSSLKDIKSVCGTASTPSKVNVLDDSVIEGSKDSNGNPITMDTFVPNNTSPEGKKGTIEPKVTGLSETKGRSSPLSAQSSSGAKESRFLKKCKTDNNANTLQESASSSSAPTCKGEEKTSYDAVLNYSPKSSSLRKKSSTNTAKVIYHSIQVEEPRSTSKDISPEPVYTLTSRPSLDGTAPKIEIKSVTKRAPSTSETVSAEFKVTLPKLKSSSAAITSFSETDHNNKSASSEEDAQEPQNKSTIITINDGGMNDNGTKIKSKESSPVPILKKSTVLRSSSKTPEREASKINKPSSSLTRRSISKSREATPTFTSTLKQSTKDKSPTPPVITAEKGTLTNGDKYNINNSSADVMGPHSSKYLTNRNERYGRYATPSVNRASDSSDNESDGLSSSSPRGSGKFRPKDGYEKAGLTGLRNIGNTCFMNTVLQCLSNTKPLLEYVVKDNYESDINRTTSGMKGALMRAFGDLIRELWREQRVVDTSAFKDQIQRFAPRFMGYSQQDAQEFLRYLLEGLHEDVNRITSKPTPIHTDIDDSLSDNDKAMESWRRYLRYESSKIVDMFVGQFKSTLRCTVCGHCSVTFDPFWDLSLPIPGRSSNIRLSQCFELLTKEEVLDGDEKPTCAKCQCRRKCTKSLAIQKFPKILVVHLKRFSLAERYRGKLSTLVDYPLSGLDLTQFAARGGQVSTYNLYGVANHSGSTYSGHYIAYCKHPYSGEWHCYNDGRVSPISPHSVVSSEGYVLFYEQVGQTSSL